jgi:CheY-like chemotaxis protein
MLTILFIASDPHAREWWCLALRTRGHQAVAIAPGLDALITAATPFDAIVIDIDLAADWQQFHVFGQEKAQLRAPLVVLTSWIAQDYRRAAFSAGCDAFVSKPCSPDELLEVIGRLTPGARAVRAAADRPTRP